MKLLIAKLSIAVDVARYRTIAGVEHVVYDSMEEFRSANPEGIVNLDWRKGREGDWVLADDGSVMQVLKFGKVSSHKVWKSHPPSTREYIRTAAGTFVIINKTRLDSNFRENIYSFGGHWTPPSRLSSREWAFVSLIIAGYDPVRAYLKLFRTEDEGCARTKAYLLIRKERIMTAIKDAIEKAGKDTGATLEWAMETIKETVEESDKDSIKIRGAGMIADLHTKDKDDRPTGGGMLGVFKGFGAGELPEEEKRQIRGIPIQIEES